MALEFNATEGLLNEDRKVKTTLKLASAVDPRASIENYEFVKGNEKEYLKFRNSNELVKQVAGDKLFSKVEAFKDYDHLWKNQAFMDISSPYLKEVLDIVNNASHIPTMSGREKFGAYEHFSSNFLRSFRAAKRGEAVMEGKRDAEQEHLRVIQDFTLPEETEGFSKSFSAGAGQIIGSTVVSMDELLRNFGSYYGVAYTLNAIPTVPTQVLGKAMLGGGKLAQTAQAALGAQAVYEGTVDGMSGNLYRDIEAAHPDMPKDEVEARAIAGGRLMAGVESLSAITGFVLGKSVATGLNKYIRSPNANIAVIESSTFARRVIKISKDVASVSGKTGVVVAGELAQEMVQKQIEDAAIEIEQELKDSPYKALATTSALETGKDIANILNPFEEMNEENIEFFGESADFATAIGTTAAIAFGFGRYADRYSSGEKAEKSDYQESLDDVRSAINENEQIINSLKTLDEAEKKAGLANKSPHTQKMMDKAIGEKVKVTIDTDAFFQIAEEVIKDTSIPAKERKDIKASFEMIAPSARNAAEQGIPVDVPYDLYKKIFKANDSYFEKSLDFVSLGQGGLTNAEIKKAVEAKFKAQNANVMAQLDNDYVFNKVLDIVADDVKIADDDKQAIAAMVQMMTSTIGQFSGGKTSAEVWKETGVQFSLAQERLSKDKTLFRKVLDLVRGIDYSIKDPEEFQVRAVQAMIENKRRIESVSEIRSFMKNRDKKITRKQIENMTGKKPVTVRDVLNRVGGLSHGLTSVEFSNLKDVVKKSKGKKKITDYYPTELVDALGVDMARRHIKSTGVGIDDFAKALHAEGFFPEQPDPAQIDFDEVYDLLRNIDSYNPDIEHEVRTAKNDLDMMSMVLESYDITPESTDAEIARFIDMQNEVFEASQKGAKQVAELADDIPFFSMGGQQEILGTFSNKGNIIRVAKNGNATTYLHEYMHFFISQLENAVRSGIATKQWKDNYEKLRKFSGLKDGEFFFGKNGVVNTNERAANEKVVSGFERYLAEGNAPVQGLSMIFAHMKKMFMDFYKLLKNAGVPINDDIRSVYDQMFASYEDVKKAKKANGYAVVKKPEGVSQEFYDAYINNHVKGDAIASSSLYKQALEDADRILGDELAAYRQKAEADVRAKLADDEIFNLIDELKETPLNIETIIEAGGDHSLLPRGLKTNKGGLDAQIIAEFRGFKSVAEMVERIASKPKKEDVIKGFVEKAVREEALKVIGRETPLKAITDRNYFDATIRKSVMLGGKPEETFEATKDSVISSATKRFLNTKLPKAVNRKLWQNGMLRHNNKATAAFIDGDEQAAFKEGRLAAISILNTEFSYVAEKKLRAFESRIKRFKTSREYIKTIGQDNYDLIASILNNFELRNIPLRTEASTEQLINSFVDRVSKELSLPDIEALKNFTHFLSNPLSYKELTYYEFTVLDDIVSKLIKLSRQTQFVKMEKERLTNDEYINAVLKTPVAFKLNSEYEGIAKGFAKAMTKMTTVPTVFSKALGEVYTDYILPFKDGHAKANNMKADLENRIGAIYDVHGVKFKSKKTHVSGVGSMSDDMLMVAGYNLVSSKHNWANYTKTWANTLGIKNLSKSQEQAIIDAIPDNYLKAADDVIQSVMAETYPLLRSAIKENAGVWIEEVVGDPVTVRGMSFKGGYYPATKKEDGREIDSIARAAVDMFGVYSSGITKERKEGEITGNLELTSRGLMTYIYNAPRHIHVVGEYNKLTRLLNLGEHRLRNHFGDYMYGELKNWVRQSMISEATPKLLRMADGGFKVYILGGRMTTALVQNLGVLISADVVGYRWVAPELGKFVADPRSFMFTIKKAMGKSNYMRDRFDNVMQTIVGAAENNPEILTSADKKLNQARYLAMYGISYFDSVVSTVTWNAQYNKSIAHGKSERQAMLEADDAVRQTQGDFSKYAKPEWLRANMSFLTPFMTYFSAIGSRLYGDIYAKDYRSAVSLAGTAFVVSIFFESVMRLWLDDEEEEITAERVIEKMREQAIGAIGNVVFPVAGIGALTGQILAGEPSYARELPMVQVAGEIANATKSTLEIVEAGLDEEKEVTKENISDILRGIGSFTGVPPKSVIDSMEEILGNSR